MTINNLLYGKVCLVTGATSGIGRETALALAYRGADVVIVGRQRKKTRAVVESIKLQTGNQGVYALLCDLSSQSQIRALAEQFHDEFSRLDVLINNAGAVFLSRSESADGIEMTFAVNHLSYFLLTVLLLDVLKASSPARVVNVSSIAHSNSVIEFDDLGCAKHYRFGVTAYCRSKLANLLFTYELSRRLEGSGVTVNALHPGVVATNLLANNGVIGRLGKLFLRFHGISPADGAATSIFLATEEEMAGVTGRYYVDCKPHQSSAASRDVNVAKKLWQVSAELVGVTRFYDI